MPYRPNHNDGRCDWTDPQHGRCVMASGHRCDSSESFGGHEPENLWAIPSHLPWAQTPKATQAHGKARMDLVPWDAVMAIADQFGTAAAKYPDRDWEERTPAYKWSTYFAALQRHAALWFQGEDTDADGNSHAVAMATNAVMLLAYVLRDHPGDDRPKSLKRGEDNQ